MEYIIVAFIVATVVLLAGRSLYQTLTGKGCGCGCDDGGCSLAAFCDPTDGAKVDRADAGQR